MIIKKKYKIKTVFFLALIINMILTTIAVGCIVSNFLWFDIVDYHRNYPLVRILFIIITLIPQYISSRLLVQGPLKKIVEFNNALKEVKEGNFDVSLNQDTNVIEINEISASFNSMTEELTNTELFRNDFISNVSHEFKTPLSAIEGYATLLQSKNITEEKRNLYTSKILYNTKRLSNLTGNILMLSNLENQNFEIKKEKFHLDEQIRQSILIFENQWDKKKLYIDVDLNEVNYYGNREMLDQVWQNLIGNAIKFIDEKGRIEIKLRNSEANVIIIIKDNGVGMDEKTKRRIFEKFYQGETSHTEEGNGLGLNIVKKIIDLHKGKIEVKSSIGKGSEFIIKLPQIN